MVIRLNSLHFDNDEHREILMKAASLSQEAIMRELFNRRVPARHGRYFPNWPYDNHSGLRDAVHLAAIQCIPVRLYMRGSLIVPETMKETDPTPVNLAVDLFDDLFAGWIAPYSDGDDEEDLVSSYGIVKRPRKYWYTHILWQNVIAMKVITSQGDGAVLWQEKSFAMPEYTLVVEDLNEEFSWRKKRKARYCVKGTVTSPEGEVFYSETSSSMDRAKALGRLACLKAKAIPSANGA